MGSGKILCLEERVRIQTLRQEGYSNRNIARRIGRSTWVVNAYLKNIENYGNNRRGRIATATTAREHHKQARLEFARNHLEWVDEWKTVVFSDEKKFNLDGPDGFQYYFHDLRLAERFLSRGRSRAGSVMVWGAISSRGAVGLEIVEGRQTAQRYLELLQRQVANIDLMFPVEQWTFQHDNAPIHTARIINTWINDNNIDILEWPALSPDLNIIENLWGWMTKQVYSEGKQFNTREALMLAIRTTWEAIPINLLIN